MKIGGREKEDRERRKGEEDTKRTRWEGERRKVEKNRKERA